MININRKVLKIGLLAGLVMLIFGLGFAPLYNFIFPSVAQEYTNPALFRPWSDPLMSLFFAYPFVLGIVLSWVWSKAKKMFTGKTEFERAKNFALAYFIVAGLPGMLITYSSFQVSFWMILAWSISGLVDAFIAGLVFAKSNN